MTTCENHTETLVRWHCSACRKDNVNDGQTCSCCDATGPGSEPPDPALLWNTARQSPGNIEL